MNANVYNIWTNNRHANSVRAFRSALTFRKNVRWQWSEQASHSHLWVLDAHELSAADLAKIEKGYMSIKEKPNVAVVGAFSSEVTLSCEDWAVFSSPFSVVAILQWLDGEIVNKTKAETSQIKVSDWSAGAALEKPWRSNQFKLTGWPNIAQFGSRVHIAITCSNLLSDYHSFESAQQWGTPPDLLDELLISANKSSLLKIKEGKGVSYGAAKRVLDEKYNQLVQKLIKWL